MKKKYLNLAFIFVLTLVIGVSKVSALITGGSATSDGVSGGGSGGNYIGSWENGVFEGIRLTLVDSDGNRISGTHSIDFRSTGSEASIDAYYNTSRNSKKELWNSEGDPTFNVSWENVSLPLLGDFLGDSSYDFPLYQGGYKSNLNGDENYFFNKFYNMDDDSLLKILNNMTNSGSYKNLIRNQSVCKSLKDGYLIVEPLTAITIRNEYYILTASEALLLARQLNSTNLYDSRAWRYNMYFSIYVGSSVTSLAGFSQVADIKNSLYCIDFDNCSSLVPTVDEFNLDKSRGYSVGVFKFADIYNDIPCTTTCYKVDYTCDSTTCTNTDDNNKRSCSTQVSSYECPYDSVDNTYHQSGKKTINLIDGVCSLYCTETATVSYPGNVGSAILLGTNLEWPTSLNGKYPLSSKSTLSCKVEMNDNTQGVTQECLNLAANKSYQYINKSGTKVTYSQPTKSGNSISTTTGNIILNDSCSYSIDVNGDNVVINNKCSYSLPSNKNIGVKKETLNFINVLKESASNGATNYIIMKNGGVLPVDGFSWQDTKVFPSALFDSKYDLQVSDMQLGYDGQFTSTLNRNPYICNYKITTDISGSCVCPPGTKYAGANLSKLQEKNPSTCAEAQEVYCSTVTTCDENPELCVCPDDSKNPGMDISNCLLSHDYDYCVKENCDNGSISKICTMPDGSKKDITDCWYERGQNIEAERSCTSDAGCVSNYCPSTSKLGKNYNYRVDPNYEACLSGGGTSDYCMNLVCNPECDGGNCDYVCPNDSDYPGMDISNCVSRERGSGKTLVEALNICKNECNISGGGKIIYRTISLENPFPSKDADASVSQNLSIGTFNDTIKGRYPGANWNGITLVKNKILNNRGYDGSNIYKEAEPLYIIELDAKSIKKIREYNKAQAEGYADFTLECTNGAYCRSTFLRKKGIVGISGEGILTGGTCLQVDGKASFEKCYETKG